MTALATLTRTCAHCRRELIHTPAGWSDGVYANPTLCIASPVMAHEPRGEVA